MSTLGYHGPVTATLDWCEVHPSLSFPLLLAHHLQANYQFSHYVAEMANTVSNLFTIFLALMGALYAFNESLPFRCIVGPLVRFQFSLIQPSSISRGSLSLEPEVSPSMPHYYMKHSSLMNYL